LKLRLLADYGIQLSGVNCESIWDNRAGKLPWVKILRELLIPHINPILAMMEIKGTSGAEYRCHAKGIIKTMPATMTTNDSRIMSEDRRWVGSPEINLCTVVLKPNSTNPRINPPESELRQR
jgi:hypothetical protein